MRNCVFSRLLSVEPSVSAYYVVCMLEGVGEDRLWLMIDCDGFIAVFFSFDY